MIPEILLGSNAWVLLWSPRKILSVDPTAVADVKIHA
jgi:hypothetical protein